MKFLDLSEPQFPQVSNRINNGTYLRGWLSGSYAGNSCCHKEDDKN